MKRRGCRWRNGKEEVSLEECKGGVVNGGMERRRCQWRNEKEKKSMEEWERRVV